MITDLVRVAGALFCLNVSFTSASDDDSPLSLGMWSWSQDNFVTPEARRDLLEFCLQEGISHIDQHLGMSRLEGGYEVRNADALVALLQEASERGITVNALRGERDMFFEKNHERAMEQLKAMVKFNRSLPKEIRLVGIKYDVEPYLTHQWRSGGSDREKVIADYLAFLHQAKQYIAEQNEPLELAVDIPFWWDKPEYSFRLEGKERPLIHHIIDVVDWVGIMSYRREPNEILRLTKEEFEYAKEIAKPRSIAPGINTSLPKGEPEKVSFSGLPPADFRAAIVVLKNELSGDGSARCIMIHDYKSLVRYLSP